MSMSDDWDGCVKEFECGKHTVKIYQDTNAENPFQWDCLSTYAQVSEGYQSGKGWDLLPTDCIEDEDDPDYGEYIYSRDIEGLRKFCSENGVIAIPYYVGYNGDINECDTSRADGFVFATSDMIEKEYGDLSQKSCQRAICLLKAEFDTFRTWSEGNVYGYEIYLTADLKNNDEDEPEPIEAGACWGFYGEDYWDSGLYESVGEVIGDEYLPKKRECTLPIVPKINTAGGCHSCFVYWLKKLQQEAKKAATPRYQHPVLA